MCIDMMKKQNQFILLREERLEYLRRRIVMCVCLYCQTHGEYFGEIPYYVNHLTHYQSTKAYTYVDLWYISYHSFQQIINVNQNMNQLMALISKMRMTKSKPYDDAFECNKIAMKFARGVNSQSRSEKFSPSVSQRNSVSKSSVSSQIQMELTHLRKFEDDVMKLIGKIEIIEQQMNRHYKTLSAHRHNRIEQFQTHE
eukprot:694287_1